VRSGNEAGWRAENKAGWRAGNEAGWGLGIRLGGELGIRLGGELGMRLGEVWEWGWVNALPARVLRGWTWWWSLQAACTCYLHDSVKVWSHLLLTLLADALHSLGSKGGHGRDAKSIQEESKNQICVCVCMCMCVYLKV